MHPTRRHALSAIPSSTPTHTHSPNHPPTPTHAIAIITQTDTSLHYINTQFKANDTVTPTKAFHNLSVKQTNKSKRTSRLGDLRLDLPPSRGPPSQGHPSGRHPSRGHPSRTSSVSGASVSGPSVSATSVSAPSVSGTSVSGSSVSEPSVSATSVSGTACNSTQANTLDHPSHGSSGKPLNTRYFRSKQTTNPL